MDKSLMLEQLVNYYTDGNKARFAAMIGITPQLLSKWIERNTFDAEQLYKGCHNVSADWLLSGEGEMICEKNGVDCHNDKPELIALCKALVENYQQRDVVMGKLVTMVGELEE